MVLCSSVLVKHDLDVLQASLCLKGKKIENYPAFPHLGSVYSSTLKTVAWLQKLLQKHFQISIMRKQTISHRLKRLKPRQRLIRPPAFPMNDTKVICSSLLILQQQESGMKIFSFAMLVFAQLCMCLYMGSFSSILEKMGWKFLSQS